MLFRSTNWTSSENFNIADGKKYKINNSAIFDNETTLSSGVINSSLTQVGTITSGYLATRYSQKILLSAIYLLRGVSIIYFIFLPPSVFNSVIFGITFGMLWLSTVPPTNGIIGKVFGTKYIGLLYGIVFVSHQIGSFLGAYLSGVFYELNGNFDYAWYISIALSIFAGLIHLPIKETPIERPQIA